MGLEVYYCQGCGVKIPPKDFERKKALLVKEVAFCKDCVPKLPGKVKKKLTQKVSLKKKEEKPKKKQKKRTNRETKRKNATKKTSLPKAKEKRVSQTSLKWLWISFAAGLSVFFLSFLVFSLLPSSPKKQSSPPKPLGKPPWKVAYEKYLKVKKESPTNWDLLEKHILEVLRYSLPDERIRYQLEDDLEVLRWKRQQSQSKNEKVSERENDSEKEKNSRYISSPSSKRFHRLDCPFAKRIRKSSRQFFESRKEALQKGKKPCSVCKP